MTGSVTVVGTVGKSHPPPSGLAGHNLKDYFDRPLILTDELAGTLSIRSLPEASS